MSEFDDDSTPVDGTPADAPRLDEAGSAQFRSRALQAEFNRLSRDLGFPDTEDEIDLIDARYRIERLLGKGGMGEVYLAWDTRLLRNVALKLVRANASIDSNRLAGLLAREAQSLARVDHPNVVHVFSSGTHGDEAYIAMAFVPGVTLRRWQIEPGRELKEIVNKYIEAGRGLVAAHERGVIHRDFKPDNLIVGDDGGVRVVDFGIAAAMRSSEIGPTQPSRDLVKPEEGRGPTTTGLILGTAAYMAPEQRELCQADAKSDQFSYCVALWEALSGSLPFPPGRTDEHDMQMLRQPPLGGAGLPRWLRTILERGLAYEREHRFASMSELLTTLEKHEYRRVQTRRACYVLAALSVAMGLGWSLAPRPDGVPEDEGCEAFVRQVEDSWNPTKSMQLSADLAARDSVPDYTISELDRLVTDWQDAARSECKGDHAPHPDAPTRACMERWLDGLELALETLEEADGEQLREAPRLLSRLTPPAGNYCMALPREDVDREVADFAERARNAATLGMFESGLTWATSASLAAVRVAEPGYSLDMAEAMQARGEVLAFAGDTPTALEQLKQAQAHARARAYHELELKVLVLRAKLLAFDEQPGAAELLLEQVDPLADLLDLAAEDPRRGDIEEARGMIACARGQTSDGIRHHIRSQEIFEAARQAPDAAKALLNLGNCEFEAGRFDKAKRAYLASKHAFERAGVPPQYRNLVEVEYNLGLVASEADDLEALEYFDLVVQYGSVSTRLDALARSISLAQSHGRLEDAIQGAERGLAELDAHPDAPAEQALNLRLAAGITLGLMHDPRGPELLAQVEVDAKAFDVATQANVQRSLAGWHRSQGHCAEASSRRQALRAFMLDNLNNDMDLADFDQWSNNELTKCKEMNTDMQPNTQPNTGDSNNGTVPLR